MTLSATSKRKWKMFGFGIAVRLAGVALIYLGDGHAHWLAKALVILGVVLSIGGITVLRYMLLAEPLGRLVRRKPVPPVEV